VAQKLNKTAENTGFGGKESRNKSRNDSAVREPFYSNNTRWRDACHPAFLSLDSTTLPSHHRCDESGNQQQPHPQKSNHQ
jgi:hypothetical protein